MNVGALLLILLVVALILSLPTGWPPPTPWMGPRRAAGGGGAFAPGLARAWPVAHTNCAVTRPEASEAARSVRILAETLERNPEALLMGKPETGGD